MYDLIYSKESALNQEIAYLVKFSRPSKTQESRTLKCSSLCEFRFIGEFLANQSTSLWPCDHPVKYCYSCFILISSFNIFKIYFIEIHFQLRALMPNSFITSDF